MPIKSNYITELDAIYLDYIDQISQALIANQFRNPKWINFLKWFKLLNWVDFPELI